MLVTAIAVVLIAAVFAWRNIRSARGDRVGAIRVSAAIVVIEFAARVIQADYPATLSDRIWILTTALKEALYSGALLFVLYLSLEPLIRRTAPDLLIAWRRLLSGRWKDPLVGRDTLIGIFVGVLHTLISTLSWIIPGLAGAGPPRIPVPGDLRMLVSQTKAFAGLGLSLSQSVFIGLITIFIFSLLAWLTRRRWGGALLIFLLINTGYFFAMKQVNWTGILLAAMMAVLIARFGVLATVVQYFTFFALFHYPLLVDTSRWFFASSALSLAVLAAITLVATRAALGWTTYSRMASRST